MAPSFWSCDKSFTAIGRGSSEISWRKIKKKQNICSKTYIENIMFPYFRYFDILENTVILKIPWYFRTLLIIWLILRLQFETGRFHGIFFQLWFFIFHVVGRLGGHLDDIISWTVAVFVVRFFLRGWTLCQWTGSVDSDLWRWEPRGRVCRRLLVLVL